MPRPIEPDDVHRVSSPLRMTRRDCLRAAVGAPLAISAAPLLAAAQNEPSPARSPELSLGFGAYGLPKFTTEAAIDLVAATGFDSIELCLLPDFDSAPEKLDAERRKAIRERLASRKLFLPSLMENIPLSGDDATYKRNTGRLEAALQLARDLGGDAPPTVQTVLGGPAGKWNEVRDGFVKRLRAWVQTANAAGVPLAVKPHRMNAMSQPEDFIGVWEELGRPKSLTIVFDWSHLAYRDFNLVQQLHLVGPHLGLVAVKDAVERNDKVEFVLPGAGGAAACDYERLLQTLLKEGYRGDVSVEVSGQLWRAPGYDPRQAIKESYEFMSRQFVAAQIGRKRRPA